MLNPVEIFVVPSPPPPVHSSQAVEPSSVAEPNRVAEPKRVVEPNPVAEREPVRAAPQAGSRREAASVGPTVPPVAPAADAVAPSPNREWMSMRRAPAASSAETRVRIPPAWQIGQPEGPPADHMPPGALGDPMPERTRPGRGGLAAKLGPDVVADGAGGFREAHETFVARVDRDGTVHFADKGNVGADGITSSAGVGLAGHFDLTDGVMRAMGEDPYRYEKTRFMERTRAERAAMAAVDRTERMRDAIDKMPAYLERIWRQSAWSAAARRRALFELWDEVAEEGEPELVRTGAAVRAAIVGFIRRRLPNGSAEAFPPAELETMNRARRSRARFEPY